jgi:imidazoleglycerol-phosphate dehydratase/histidinol-phosphatase
VRPLLSTGRLDPERSCVVGTTAVDLVFAANLGIRGALVDDGPDGLAWDDLARLLLATPRTATLRRETKETTVEVSVDLDATGADVETGIAFFDHMLDQLAKHGGFRLHLRAAGDLAVDAHHTVEDVALTLGAALAKALGDKLGIGRYGFYLPMDEASAKVAVDLGGRPYLVFRGELPRCDLGGFPTEMAPHFFRSFADGLKATLHVELQGENAHHMVESAFKGLARSLAPALARTGQGELPSTKGVL